MNRRTLLSLSRSAVVAFALLIMGLVLSTNTASAQCPDYWVNINYLVPAPHPGPVSIDIHWSNGTITSHSFNNDGHFTFPQAPFWGPAKGVVVNGVLVPVGAKVKVPDPALPPNMCIEVEVRFDSNGCLEVKLQPQGC